LPHRIAAADNVLMSQPFQFSMCRMFVAMALFSVSAWSFSAIVKLANKPNVAVQASLLLVLMFVSVGGGLGAITGRPIPSVGWALLLAIAFILFAIPVVHR
jgi:hypothetical protein